MVNSIAMISNAANPDINVSRRFLSVRIFIISPSLSC